MPPRPDMRVLLRVGALNGECPTWCARRRRLFWVDVRAPSFNAFDPATGRNLAWEMPAMIGSFALYDAHALVALRTGLFRLDLASAALDFVAPSPFAAHRFACNDGGIDPRGRFLVGPMFMPLGGAPAEPAMERLHAWMGGAWHPVSPPVRVSNGLGFSPDGRLLYHADTHACTIWVADYEAETARARNRRVFVHMADAPEGGGPDGAAVDADGFYWCAVFGGGCLRRYDPAGRMEREVALPVRYPTMPALGGADGRTLFVTSACWPLTPAERARAPDEGALLALEAPCPAAGRQPPR